jgi:YggT family protein
VNTVADFLAALILVYTILIIAWILLNLALSFGFRPPYSRATDGIIGFLRDTVEPYLRIFRRFIPPLGPLDLSPIVAILLLQIVGGILVGILRGAA